MKYSEKELMLTMMADAVVFERNTRREVGLGSEKEKPEPISEQTLKKIRSMRRSAWAYKAIGVRLRLSERAVSVICKKHGIA